MGQSGLVRQHETTASLQLNIKRAEKEEVATTDKCDHVGGTSAKESLCLEFTHAELYSLFNDFERIQKQLDNLAS